MGSFGRLDQNIEAAAGDEKKYIRLNTNRSVSNSYKDGIAKLYLQIGNAGMQIWHWAGRRMKTLGRTDRW